MAIEILPLCRSTYYKPIFFVVIYILINLAYDSYSLIRRCDFAFIRTITVAIKLAMTMQGIPAYISNCSCFEMLLFFY